MNNVSHVCFACRRVMRRDAEDLRQVPCSSCGGPAEPIGDRVPVPRRGDLRAWASFEAAWRARRERRADEVAEQQVRTRHAIEQRIADLESRDGDPTGRRSELRVLRWRLAHEFPAQCPGDSS